MIPVLTPDQSRALDAAAEVPLEVLVHRAGGHVARHALDMLGGTYGRRVVVVAGNGNNGADGRDAAERLRRAGVRVEVIAARDAPERLPPADLVIDAAVGTGFAGTYNAPDVGGVPVLSIDVPSGIDALTGVERGRANQATRTVTFAAAKPGLLHGTGRRRAGEVVVADIGLDVGRVDQAIAEAHDVAQRWPLRRPDDHKWKRSVLVVAGSPGMTGAGWLAVRGAQRGGAGMVRMVTRADDVSATPIEAIADPLPEPDWHQTVVGVSARFGAVVIGPGLGRDDHTCEQVRLALRDIEVPVVVDADALHALGDHRAGLELLAGRPGPTVLTPHEGEFAKLFGEGFESGRADAAGRLADATLSTVVLKGPSTVVASPTGPHWWVIDGDERLATAGTGDVLAGVIASGLAGGASPADAAMAGVFLHATAGRLVARHGAVAGDVADMVPEAIASVFGERVG